jgi:two-component system response regulator HydG
VIAVSEAMRRLLERIERVAGSAMPVLFAGETGTGKEVLAHALHRASGRPGRIVAVNCTAIAAGTAESELDRRVR